ncbi:MAG TPA: AAA family ATPase [Bacteroidales bacterium]
MERIQIEGYKSIKSLDLVLAPINILIGANGSGKSNFLSFFELLKHVYNCNLKEYVALKGGTDKFLHLGSKITSEISTKLFFRTNAYSFTLKQGEGSFIFVKEGLWYLTSDYSSSIDVASLNDESKLRFQTVSRAKYIRTFLDSLEKYHFHDTSTNSPFTKVSNINTDTFRLYDKGENIAAFLYNIREKHITIYHLILKTIQSIAPYFLDFVLNPDENGNLRLLWKSKFGSQIYSVNDLSDGTIRFIALTTLFMQPNLPQTIIIDEPELGLHPAAVVKFSGLIQSAAAKNCQIILATQSADLISYFEPEDIITVDQIKGESVFKRLDSSTLGPWLEEYALDDLWKRNIIATGQPNSILE